MRRFLLAAILTLALAAPVIASNITVQQYGNDKSFTARAQLTDPSVCACGSLEDTVTITNTGDYTSTYTLNTNVDASIPRGQVTLQPGQQATLPVTINKQCGADITTEDYVIDVTDTYNQTRRIDRDLTTNKCQSLTASLTRQSNTTVNPCQPVNYTVRTINPAPFPEDYTVKADGTTVDDFTLQPGQDKLTNISQQYSCDTYGEQTPRFTVSSDNNGLTTTLQDNITINQDYPYDTAITQEQPQPQPSCPAETYTATVEVTNDAPFNNSYRVDTTNITATTNTVSLDAGETTTFTVTATEDEPTTQPYAVTLTSDKGNVAKTITNQYSYTSCYDTTTSTPQSTQHYCGDNNALPVTITNNGRFTTEYTTEITTDHPNTTGSTTTTVLQPNTSTTTNAAFTTQAKGIDDAELTATTTYQARTNQTQTHTATTPVELRDTYQCTKLTIDDTADAYYGHPLSLNVQNNGIRTTTYTLASDTASITPENTTITLSPGEAQDIPLNYDVNESVPYRNTVSITAENTANGYEYTQDVNIDLTQTPWWYDLAAYTTTNTCAQITTALLAALLLILALTPWVNANTFTARALLLLAAALIIAGLAATQGLPQVLQPDTTVTANGGLTITLPANETTTVNLNDYYTDPDNDALSYTVTPESDHLSVANATLRANADTKPTNHTAEITAEDTNNATTTTQLTLTTTDRPPTATRGIYEANCSYLNWVLLAILLIALTGWTTKPDQWTPPRRPETTTEESDTQDTDDEDNRPDTSNTKDEIKAWLDDHDYDYTTRMTKDELLDIVDHDDD